MSTNFVHFASSSYVLSYFAGIVAHDDTKEVYNGTDIFYRGLLVMAQWPVTLFTVTDHDFCGDSPAHWPCLQGLLSKLTYFSDRDKIHLPRPGQHVNELLTIKLSRWYHNQRCFN